MAGFIKENSRSYVRMRSPDHERLREILHGAGIDCVPGRDGALEVEGEDAAHLGELAARHRIVLHELSPQSASLEEAFMRLTAESVEYHAHENHRGAAGQAAPGVGPGAGWGADWRKKGP